MKKTRITKESENHRFSIIFTNRGWDCSVQEDAPSEKDAIAIAVKKGKIKNPKKVVKVVDLGVPGSYWKDLPKGKPDNVRPDPWETGRVNTDDDGFPLMERGNKLVKEGAGAGYTVTLKNVKLTNAKVINRTEDGDWEFEADIVKDSYMVEAEDYYNRFCPISEYDEEWVEVAGKVYGVCWWYEEERDVERQVNGQEQDIGFDYGAGWVHANLPKDGHITADRIRADEHDTWAIQSIELFAPQVSDAVNYCHEHFLDEVEDGEEGEDVVNEVSGWKLEDEDLTLVNDESYGDKLYIVKLWWGSGYQLDCYNAYAFSAEEALNHVVAYCEKNQPQSKWLQTSDNLAKDLKEELAADNGIDESEADELPEFQETFMYVDATMEGASEPHYIWAENLAIAEYPDEHNHPMSKGIKRNFNESDSVEPTLDDIYKAVKEEYGGKLFSDNFLKLNVEHVSGQVLCIFELDKPDDMGANDGDDEWWEDKKDSAILFYDELVKFLVDKFGEKFRFTDPRVSDEYADKSDPKANFEILIDDDDATLPIIAIDEVADGWYAEPEENEDDVVTESYDDEWAEVGAAFDEFRGRLWKYTRKDRESRMEFFQDCMKKCEEAFKEYADMCVFD